MVSGETDICNLALQKLNVGKRIVALTEKSREARACKLAWPVVRDKILADYDWNFARRTAALALLPDSDNPDSDRWLYPYFYPTDCLRILRFINPFNDDPLAFEIQWTGSKRVILSNTAEAKIRYTARVVDVSQYSDAAVLCMAYALAVEIAPELTKGTKIGDLPARLYQLSLKGAQARSASEEELGDPPATPSVRARK